VGKIQGPDAIGEAGEALAERAGLGVPEDDFLVGAAGDELPAGAVGDGLDQRQDDRR